MSTTVSSVISHGASGLLVEIECHLSNSLPGIVIVGAGSRNVDEAKERIRGAFSSAGFSMPRKRITINLAPADSPKDGSSLDLPIAIAILKASGDIPTATGANELFIGELGLDGRLRPVRGVIGKLLSGREHGYRKFYIPHDNLQQARMVPGIKLMPVSHLNQIVDHLVRKAPLPLTGTDVQDTGTSTGTYSHAPSALPPTPSASTPSASGTPASDITIDDITGQPQAKRALTIAAAGGHNILLSGPPGSGKSMLARALASILPPLSREEMLEVTHLHSLSSRNYDQLISTRPFRTPHHSASHPSIVGGGTAIRPGEISLAHRGVLFLDELPEFKRDTIEALRQPLEDKTITITRSRDTVVFPANFILVATANPCPCGHYMPAPPADHKALSNRILCDCPPAAISHYQRKLSGPLLDRIDLNISVEPVKHAHLLSDVSDNNRQRDHASIKRLVALSRTRQRSRFGARSAKLNSDMSNQEIRQLANLSTEAASILNAAATNLKLSARSYMRCIKVARTIADLAGSSLIESEHLTEALHYRPAIAGQV